MSTESRGSCAASRRYVRVKRVDECATHRRSVQALPAGFRRRLPAAHLQILDRAIGMGCPMTLAIAGPVTVSGQHQTWLIPLLETGWIAYLSTTDAVCYHDGHRSLDEHQSDPIHEVPIFGDDGALRDENTIRVTDMAFDEDVLLDQDRFMTAVLPRPEFQQKMTGTELRYRLGRVLRRAGGAERRRGRAAGHLPAAGDPGLRRRAGGRQRVPQFDEAVGDAAGRADRRSTASISTCTPRSSSRAPTTAGGCSIIPRTRWRR